MYRVLPSVKGLLFTPKRPERPSMILTLYNATDPRKTWSSMSLSPSVSGLFGAWTAATD
jgi:hypothetical protein